MGFRICSPHYHLVQLRIGCAPHIRHVLQYVSMRTYHIQRITRIFQLCVFLILHHQRLVGHPFLLFYTLHYFRCHRHFCHHLFLCTNYFAYGEPILFLCWVHHTSWVVILKIFVSEDLTTHFHHLLWGRIVYSALLAHTRYFSTNAPLSLIYALAP